MSRARRSGSEQRCPPPNRASTEPRTVQIALDLDRFKKVNDDLGHDAGDRLLVAIATAVAGALRTSDVLVRLGGDEFLVLCPGTPQEGAVALAERLRTRIRHTAEEAAPTMGVSASLGIATYPADAAEVSGLTRRADEALYAAKAQGRDSVATWRPEAKTALP